MRTTQDMTGQDVTRFGQTLRSDATGSCPPTVSSCQSDIFDGGLMVWDADVSGSDTSSRYSRPATQAEALEVLNAFVHLRLETFALRFASEVPAPFPGLNFLLLGMGEFALHRSLLRLARKKGVPEVVQLLEEAGAPE